MNPHDLYAPPEEYLHDFSGRKGAFDFNLSVDVNNSSDKKLTIFERLCEEDGRIV